jgi:hypothetical protein
MRWGMSAYGRFERTEKEVVVAYSKYFLGNELEGIRKTHDRKKLFLRLSVKPGCS